MISSSTPLLLGSGSPRRLEILQTLRIPTVAVPGRAQEVPASNECPEAYIDRVTREKLCSVAGRATSQPTGGVLVADTIVLVDQEILGKPTGIDQAIAMLGRLSGRAHDVWTRFVVASAARPDLPLHEQTVCTRVFFRNLSQDEIVGYAKTKEGLDKAGAYAVQGLGSFAITRLEGSYGNVVGLPACEVISSLLGSGLLDRFPL